MGRSSKRQVKEASEEGDEIEGKSLVYCSSDDSEANADLTLRIAERASRNRVPRLRSIETGRPYDKAENTDAKLVLAGESKASKKSKKLKSIPVLEEATRESAVKTVTSPVSDVDDVKVAEPVDDSMLRRLLRGPRYFDPPENGWMACFNCGEDGHIAVNCTSLEKKLKPCFICGSLEHLGRRCSKAIDCFICKQTGHRAKDCPDKWNRFSKNLIICLKCGDSGHDMFSCRNPYSPNDLQQIQCYVCKNFGHLCCLNCDDNSKKVISCYKCGESGHDASCCSDFYNDVTDAYFEKKEKSSKYGKIKAGSKSALAVLEKGISKKKPRKGKSNVSSEGKEKKSKKGKKRSEWIMEDHEETRHRRSKKDRLKSPSTPSKRASGSHNEGKYAYREPEKRRTASRNGYSDGYYEENYPESAYNTPSSCQNGGYSDHYHSHSNKKKWLKNYSNGFQGHSHANYSKLDHFESDAYASHGNHFRSWSGKKRKFL